MTDSTSPKPGGKPRQTAENIADTVTDQMKSAGEAMRQSGERMTEVGTNLGMKLLDQAEANTREAFAAMRAAAHAKDASEVMRIQQDYLRAQSSRAMEQAREIGTMITDYGRQTIEQIAKKS